MPYLPTQLSGLTGAANYELAKKSAMINSSLFSQGGMQDSEQRTSPSDGVRALALDMAEQPTDSPDRQEYLKTLIDNDSTILMA